MQLYTRSTWIAFVVKEHLLELQLPRANASRNIHAQSSEVERRLCLDGVFRDALLSSAVGFSAVKSRRAREEAAAEE